MSLIRPFAALRPAPGYAAQVAAPPYDVLNGAEARARASGKPWSFLHVSRAEIDLAPATDPHDPAVYAKAAENFSRMLQECVLVRDPQPCYYVYRLTLGEHVQTGLVAVASVRDYENNRIRRHELTRPDKEDDRVRQIQALNAQTGPVLLAYPSHAEVDALLVQAASGAPELDVTADDGVRHALWVIRDPEVIARLTLAFDTMLALYIADGHHRSAAAARVAAARRAADPNAGEQASYDYFLSVIFPHHQMRILDYNRVVRDLNGLDPAQFLERVCRNFSVRENAGPVRPSRPGEFGCYLAHRWYRLQLHPELREAHDPVANLDVSLLAMHLIEPLLGIRDPRRDPRIDFVGGIRGLTELERRVDSGEMAVAFSLFPTRMEELMAVADAGLMMPPKSTWFEPKLADGLVSYVLDE